MKIGQTVYWQEHNYVGRDEGETTIEWQYGEVVSFNDETVSVYVEEYCCGLKRRIRFLKRKDVKEKRTW